MSTRSSLLSWLGALLVLTGVFIGLFFSATVVWAEIETRVYSGYSADEVIKLKCPLMISPAESGTVSAEIVNLTDKEIKPVVNAEISQAEMARRITQTFILAPGESQGAQWVVNSSDAIFNNLILVNIRQSQYRDNPSRWGSCGILLFSLFGMTGIQTLSLIFVGSIAALILGGGLWFYFRKPSNYLDVNIAQAGTLLAGMIIAALLSTLPRWWGLTLFLDVVSLLMLGTMIVEFFLFPKKDKD